MGSGIPRFILSQGVPSGIHLISCLDHGTMGRFYNLGLLGCRLLD